MLADAEDEGVVEDEIGALGLRDVEVVALGVWGGVQRQERVGRVAAGMGYGQADG